MLAILLLEIDPVILITLYKCADWRSDSGALRRQPLSHSRLPTLTLRLAPQKT